MRMRLRTSASLGMYKLQFRCVRLAQGCVFITRTAGCRADLASFVNLISHTIVFRIAHRPSLLASGHHTNTLMVHCIRYCHSCISWFPGTQAAMKALSSKHAPKSDRKIQKTRPKIFPAACGPWLLLWNINLLSFQTRSPSPKKCYHHLIFARSLPLFHFKSLNYSTTATIVAPCCLPFRWSTAWKTKKKYMKRVEIAARGLRARFVSMQRIKNINTQ